MPAKKSKKSDNKGKGRGGAWDEQSGNWYKAPGDKFDSWEQEAMSIVSDSPLTPISETKFKTNLINQQKEYGRHNDNHINSIKKKNSSLESDISKLKQQLNKPAQSHSVSYPTYKTTLSPLSPLYPLSPYLSYPLSGYSDYGDQGIKKLLERAKERDQAEKTQEYMNKVDKLLKTAKNMISKSNKKKSAKKKSAKKKSAKKKSAKKKSAKK